MKETNLVPRKWGNSLHYDFRHRIPPDLIDYFEGRRQFQISLNNVSSNETVLVARSLKSLVLRLFSEIREGMRELTLEDVKEILRTEVRKSILHSSHVSSGHDSIYDSMRKVESLEKIYEREINLKKSVLTNQREVTEKIDQKLEDIIQSLEITFDKQNLNYKKLRKSFIDLYIIRFEWIKGLINESGKTDDDFRREVDKKLSLNLFPELLLDSKDEIQVTSESYEEPITSPPVQLGKFKSLPLSEVIQKYFDDKQSSELRVKSEMEVTHSLNLLMEDFGDIPVGSVDIEKGTNFKNHIRVLPKNRSKLPKFRDKSFHEMMQMNTKKSEQISPVTFNKHLGYASSFFGWCVTHGYADSNPFKGMKQKLKVRPQDQRERFSEIELKKIFDKNNYIYYTDVEKGRFELYWVPLISLFSGMRLGEICPLYLDNIRQISGNHREKRWCFDIVEEPERPDKRLKTLSSRRIVPIHDNLIYLGLIDFIQLLKKREPNRQRLFQELKEGEFGYNRNVSRFFNERYLPKLDLKTSKKNFHSLRHTVSDHLKQKGIEPHFINELLGHASGNIDLERYGKGYNPDIIYNKCVKRIVYETSHTRGIDFKSLKVDWNRIINR